MKMNQRLYAAAVAALLLNATAVAPSPLRRLWRNRHSAARSQPARTGGQAQRRAAAARRAAASCRCAAAACEPDVRSAAARPGLHARGPVDIVRIDGKLCGRRARPQRSGEAALCRATWRSPSKHLGSVGKLVVVLALFQALADIHPDIAARQRVLKETVVTADGFSQSDSHTCTIRPRKTHAAPGPDRRPRDAV